MNLVEGMMKAVAGVLLRPYTQMPGRSFRGVLPVLDLNQSEVAVNCEKHVRALSVGIGERHIGKPSALKDSVNYIENAFTEAGYVPAFHTMELLGQTLYNVEAVLRGKSRRSIVVGAHYDTIPGCAGADDNASGMAAMFEVARIMRYYNPSDTIRFVAFANEEHPGLPPETLGSYDYARNCKASKMDIRGMMTLEMLGYFSDAPGSQKYPFPFNLLYPTTGNFVGFIGNDKSKPWVHQCIRAFRTHAQFPSDGVAAPEFVNKNGGRSDHWSFWKFGYPGVMITDTANFRNPNYHHETDTADTLNYPAMGRVVVGIADMLKEMTRTR